MCVLEAGLNTDKENVFFPTTFVGETQNGDGFNALRLFYAQITFTHDGDNRPTVAVRNPVVSPDLQL